MGRAPNTGFTCGRGNGAPTLQLPFYSPSSATFVGRAAEANVHRHTPRDARPAAPLRLAASEGHQLPRRNTLAVNPRAHQGGVDSDHSSDPAANSPALRSETQKTPVATTCSAESGHSLGYTASNRATADGGTRGGLATEDDARLQIRLARVRRATGWEVLTAITPRTTTFRATCCPTASDARLAGRC